jgi:hypothetical protein
MNHITNNKGIIFNIIKNNRMPKEIKKDRLKNNIIEVIENFEDNDPEMLVEEDLLEKKIFPHINTDFNEYDNDYTKVLKLAVKYKVSSDYIYYDDETKTEISLWKEALSSPLLITDPSSDTLQDFYEHYIDYFYNINVMNWINLFVHILQNIVLIEDLLNIINGFITSQNGKELSSIKDLGELYKIWRRSILLKREKEYALTDQIIDIQEFIDESLQSYPFSPYAVTKERYEYTIELDEDPLTSFHSIQVTPMIPWVLSTYDPYNPMSSDMLARDESIIVKVLRDTPKQAWDLYPEEPIENYWYMALWVEKDGVMTIKESSFVLLVLNLSTKKLVINVPVERGLSQKTILDRIYDVFPGLSIISTKKKQLSADFSVYGVSINEYSFSDMVINDELLNNYLIIDESSSSIGKKKRFTIQLKPSDRNVEYSTKETIVKSSIITSISMNYSSKNEQFEVYGSSKPIVLPEKTPILTFNVSYARDSDTLELFMRLMGKLLFYYASNYKTIEDEYERMIGSVAMSNIANRQSSIGSGIIDGKSKIQQLKIQAPDVIVSNYATLCQSKNQPTIISEEERYYWEKVQKRNVLEYLKPPQNKYLFVCPSNDNPYVTIIENTKLKNKDKYPYVPCCTNKDPSKDPNSWYTKLYLENKSLEDINEDKIVSKYTIRVNKVMGFFRYGTLPNLLQDLITENKNQVFRVGMVKSPSSFLHCILYASQNEDYINLTNDKDREDYVQRYRSNLNIDPNCMAQEMWDIDNEERINKLRNPYIFLDPGMFFRVFEELFNFNIYIFTGEEEKLSFIQPRCKYFSAKYYNPTKSVVLIYQHPSDNTNIFPQCELIGSTHPKDPNYSIMEYTSKTIVSKLFNLYSNVFQTMCWNYNNDSKMITSTVNSYALYNIYMFVDGGIATHQVLDSFGKLRGLVIDDKKQSFYGTLMTTPMQPFNLPKWTKNLDDLPRVSDYSFVEKYFNNKKPDSVVNNEAIYWLDDHQQNFVKVLISTKSEPTIKNSYVLSPSQLLFSPVLISSSHTKKVTGYILQLINILFVVTGYIDDAEYHKKFLAKFTSVKKNNNYDISTITNPIIPIFHTVRNVFSYFRKIMPSFVSSNEYKIILPSLIFRDRLIVHLRQFSKLFLMKELVQPSVLVGAQLNDSMKGVNLVLSYETLSLYKKLRNVRNNKILTDLSESLRNLDSFFYYLPDRSIIVYVIIVSTIEEALSIHNNWNKYRVSVSYDNNSTDVPYTLYKINQQGTLLASKTPELNDAHIIQFNSPDKVGIMLEP